VLEAVARDVAAAWKVELGEPFALALHSFAAPAGDDAALKVVPARHWESDHEPDALAHWGGDGAVRLLRHDRARRAFLVERAWPGTDISGLPDAEATAIAVDVGCRLWRQAGAPFRRVADELPRWLDEAEGALRARAEELAGWMELRHDVLVHGDFHHHNILASARGHLAIDPQPFLGEPEYDVVPFLWNPLPIGLRPELFEARLAAFVAAGLDEERIRAWMVIRGSYLLPDEEEGLLALV
jgi:streptomycin 6-kinase